MGATITIDYREYRELVEYKESISSRGIYIELLPGRRHFKGNAYKQEGIIKAMTTDEAMIVLADEADLKLKDYSDKILDLLNQLKEEKSKPWYKKLFVW